MNCQYMFLDDKYFTCKFQCKYNSNEQLHFRLK